MEKPSNKYILVIACPDRVGIIAAVSGFVAAHGGSITEADYHSDAGTGWFFMRQEILAGSLSFGLEAFRKKFVPLAKKFQMQWSVSDSAIKKRVVICVSREDHCLADLLYRWRTKELDCKIAAVISNHEIHREYVEWHGISYHVVPVPPFQKGDSHRLVRGNLSSEQSEREGEGFSEPSGFASGERITTRAPIIDRLFQKVRGEVMVLARYMQILPATLCKKYTGRILNIHHSFLPFFKGRQPYAQAYERGVKLIGATCHYVTPKLDDGPIIEQDVIRVDHGDSVEDMVRLGRDVEKTVLARGLRYHLEDRVIIHKNKTVVFR